MEPTAAKWAVLGALALFAILACTPETEPHPKLNISSYDDVIDFVERNPCGHVSFEQPYRNITGALYDSVGATIYFYPAPNHTLEALDYVQNNCAWITYNHTDFGRFAFYNAPPGKYFLLSAAPPPHRLWSDKDTAGIQWHWYLGNENYTAAAISLHAD